MFMLMNQEFLNNSETFPMSSLSPILEVQQMKQDKVIFIYPFLSLFCSHIYQQWHNLFQIICLPFLKAGLSLLQSQSAKNKKIKETREQIFFGFESFNKFIFDFLFTK